MDARREILTQASARKDEWLVLVSELVKLPSENPPCDVQAVTGWLADWLSARGLPPRLITTRPEEGLVNLVVAVEGQGTGRHVILNGHTDTFPVGTRFEVFPGSSMQIGLVGKILANFGSGAAVHWTRADPGVVELQLERGMIAVRYERHPADPILKVRTPTALVRVVGTVFTVEVDDGGDTAVAVLRGEVEVADPSSEALLAEVSAGYRFDVAVLVSPRDESGDSAQRHWLVARTFLSN